MVCGEKTIGFATGSTGRSGIENGSVVDEMASCYYGGREAPFACAPADRDAVKLSVELDARRAHIVHFDGQKWKRWPHQRWLQGQSAANLTQRPIGLYRAQRVSALKRHALVGGKTAARLHVGFGSSY